MLWRRMFSIDSLMQISVVATCLLAGGNSGVGDEEVPPHGTVPSELIDRLKTLLTDKAPDVTVTVESWGACSFAERCQEYRLHYIASKRGGFREKSGQRLGPTADGFHLELNWFPALNGGASGKGWQPVYAQDYWSLKSNAYKLKNDPGYIDLRWEYGPQTDMTILDLVRSEVEAFGDPVDDERSDGWTGKSATLKKNLAIVLEKFQADATWRTDGESLVCEFHTMEYDVHTVDDNGHVSTEAHQETGSQRDGFVIRLVPLKKAYLRQPRPVYGLSEGAYWRDYFCVVDDPDHAFRLELRYGTRTDKKLLNAVATELDHGVRANREF